MNALPIFMCAFLLVASLAAVQQPVPPPLPPDAPRTDPHDPTTGCARDAGFSGDLRLFACACHPATQHDGEECIRVTEDSQCQKYCRKDLCLCAVACEIPEGGATEPAQQHQH